MIFEQEQLLQNDQNCFQCFCELYCQKKKKPPMQLALDVSYSINHQLLPLISRSPKRLSHSPPYKGLLHYMLSSQVYVER
jgi:hypothetical protein